MFLTVRKDTAEGLAVAAKLVKDMWLLHADSAALVERSEIEGIDAEKYLRDLIAGVDCEVFVAERGGEVVGIGSGVPCRSNIRGNGYFRRAADKLPPTRGPGPGKVVV